MPTTSRTARFVACVAAASFLLTAAPLASAAAPSASQAAAPAAAQVPEIPWTECEGDGVEAFECATVEVPTDYDRPHGPTTTIAVTRLPATQPENRIGSLFLNFGGPGGPGVETLHLLGEILFRPEVRERFDLVAFDPRGVGLSDPATCFRTRAREDAFLERTVPLPLDRREELRFVAEAAILGASCTIYSHDRFASASTANVARDMDLLRAAVGDDRLTYVGYSYGTILGATYGALFPDRVRAMVLDGTIDPRVWSGVGSEEVLGVRMRQAEGFTRTFGEFTRLCAEAGPQRCPLAALGDPATVVEDLFAALLEEPVEVPVGDGTTVEVGYAEVLTRVFLFMYSSAGWPMLAAELANLAVLAGVAPGSEQPQARGGRIPGELLRRLLGAEDYPSIGTQLATMCADDTEFEGRLSEYPRQVRALEERYPHFGRLRGWVGLHCEFIHADDEDAYTGPWEQTTQAPVLVIGTRYDPATIYEFTEPYSSLWPDARTLTIEGWGHTTLNVLSSCADTAIATYLVTLEADDGAVCAQDGPPFPQSPLRQAPRTLLLPDVNPQAPTLPAAFKP